MRCFLLWLNREGFVALRDADGLPTESSEEGRAALLMLLATRPHDVRGRRPSTATIQEIARFADEPDLEKAFRRIEAQACRWDAAFLRRDEASGPTIVLSKRADGPLPVLRTLWSLPFEGASQRDRVYAWLCHRLDRWRDWGALAGQFGAEKLTHRLLVVMAASLGGEDPPRRGSVRYFGFRDLLLARIVSRLSAGGIELKRLKAALLELQRSSFWERLGPDKACAMMVTDGASIWVHEEDGSIVELTRGGQLAFAFVVDLAEADADLRKRVDPLRLEHFHYGAQEPRLVAAADDQALNRQ